jgi:hypothetical protein
VAVFLGLAAGFGGFTLGLLDAFLAVAPLGFFFRQAPFFDIAELLRGVAGAVAARVVGALAGAAALAIAGSGACVSAAGASPPTRRLPRFSTTTCLVRPWLKLWRTVPVSTRGLSVKVLVGTLSVLSPGVFVSTIQES